MTDARKPGDGGAPRAGAREIGLCAHCAHARVIDTPRSVFWLCRLSASDPRYDKYPRLPVLACEGHVEGAPERGDG